MLCSEAAALPKTAANTLQAALSRHDLLGEASRLHDSRCECCVICKNYEENFDQYFDPRLQLLAVC